MVSWLPESVSTYGADIDRIFVVIYYVTGATFFVVQGTLLAFVVLYRHREGRRAAYTHGNTALEIAWTIVPAILLVILAFVSRTVWADIKYGQPREGIEVQVTGKQFNWDFVYPGLDGKLGTGDDVTATNELHVPVDRTVRLVLKSGDVIHSFFLPNLRFKQDAVPGHEIRAWFKATKANKYEIACAELCGLGHSTMRGWLHVHSAAEYETWARENRVGPVSPAAQPSS